MYGLALVQPRKQDKGGALNTRCKLRWAETKRKVASDGRKEKKRKEKKGKCSFNLWYFLFGEKSFAHAGSFALFSLFFSRHCTSNKWLSIMQEMICLVYVICLN